LGGFKASKIIKNQFTFSTRGLRIFFAGIL
jgi:hypothetical protein